MSKVRFDHVEFTFPRGSLTTETRSDIDAFWCGVVGWSSKEHTLYGESNHLLQVDDDHFVLLGEVDDPMNQPPDNFFGDLQDIHVESLNDGQDYRILDDISDDAVVFVPHVALLYDDWDELDQLLEECKRYQEKDPRLLIKNWPPYKTRGTSMSRNVLVKYILPMWVELHALKRDPER